MANSSSQTGPRSSRKLLAWQSTHPTQNPATAQNNAEGGGA